MRDGMYDDAVRELARKRALGAETAPRREPEPGMLDTVGDVLGPVGGIAGAILGGMAAGPAGVVQGYGAGSAAGGAVGSVLKGKMPGKLPDADQTKMLGSFFGVK